MDGGRKAILHFIFFREEGGGGSRSKISWDSEDFKLQRDKHKTMPMLFKSEAFL